MVKKRCVTVFSGSVDRLTGLAVLVSGAAAMDMKVELFLQLWGAYAFKKDVINRNMNFVNNLDKNKYLKEMVANGPAFF